MSVYKGIDGAKLYTELELQEAVEIAVARISITFMETIETIKSELKKLYTDEEIKKLKSQNEEMLKELEEVGNVLYYDIDGIGNLDVARNIIKKILESQNV